MKNIPDKKISHDDEKSSKLGIALGPLHESSLLLIVTLIDRLCILYLRKLKLRRLNS